MVRQVTAGSGPILPVRRSRCAQWGMAALQISGLLLRRAVLGSLLAAGRAMSPAELAEELTAAGATTKQHLTKGPSRVIADLLAHQVRIGKVVKVGPALFGVVPSSMSRSTRQRCLRWRRELDQLAVRLRDWEARHLEEGTASPLSDATDLAPAICIDADTAGSPDSDAVSAGAPSGHRHAPGRAVRARESDASATEPALTSDTASERGDPPPPRRLDRASPFASAGDGHPSPMSGAESPSSA